MSRHDVADWKIAIDDPRADDVRELLNRHLSFTRAIVPPEHNYTLAIDGLRDPAVTFFSLRAGGELLGVAALKRLDPDHGEIKSMHTAQIARGRGVGRALLNHLLLVARERRYHDVSLETGTAPAFAPARQLYASAGFTPCAPFASYAPSPYSRCMTLSLDHASE
jgi:putative acetyltransferase